MTGKLKPSENLTAWLRRVTLPFVDRVAQAAVKLGIGPDALTIFGLIISGAAGVLAAQGRFVAAAIVYLLGVPFDGLDGAVARAGGRVTRFGALLDSTLDRYGEACILTGLGYHFAMSGQYTAVILAFASLMGSVMVSYTRARSEGLGVDNKVGLLTRVERFIITVLALLTGYVLIGLWVLAILTHFTVGQRMWHVYRVTRSDRGQPE